MPIRPYLQLYRNRLLWASALSVFFALLLLFFTSAESITDVGVLWHHFCGCAPTVGDVYAILYVPVFSSLLVGAIMGIGVGTGLGSTQNGVAMPGAGEMHFLFTRPMPRYAVLLTPILLAALAITVIPAGGLLLLLGWLRLVRAPALGHLLDIVRLMPSATALRLHPSLLEVVAATHFVLFYVSASSVGLCFYAFYFGQRWWVRSPHTWLRIGGSLATVMLPMLPALTFVSKRTVPILLMNVTAGRSLGMLPSVPLIVLHLVFAAACLFSAWHIARTAEL